MREADAEVEIGLDRSPDLVDVGLIAHPDHQPRPRDPLQADPGVRGKPKCGTAPEPCSPNLVGILDTKKRRRYANQHRAARDAAHRHSTQSTQHTVTAQSQTQRSHRHSHHQSARSIEQRDAVTARSHGTDTAQSQHAVTVQTQHSHSTVTVAAIPTH